MAVFVLTPEQEKAGFGALPPRGHRDASDRYGGTDHLDDSRSTEQAYYEKTAIFPIMHAAAVRSSLLDEQAGMAASIFSALRIDEHKICNGCLVIGHPIAQEPETIGALWIPGTHVAVTQIAPALRSQNAVAQGHLSLAKLAYFSRRP